MSKQMPTQEINESASSIGSADARSNERYKRMSQQLYRAANELKRTNQFQSMILETIREGVIVFDEMDQLAAWNPAFCKLYDIDESALRNGMSSAKFAELFKTSPDRSLARTSINAHLTSLHSGEFVDLLENGTSIEVRITTREAGGLIVTYSDITPHLEVQSILKDQRQMLRSQVEELTELGKSLNEARNRAVASDKEKSRFLAMLSHDIRTPMSAMISTLEVLSSPGQEADKHRLLEVALASSKQMLFLLADIIEVSRTEGWNFQLHYEATDIVELVASTADAWRPFANSKGLELDLQISDDTPNRMQSDGKRLRQVIDNLLSNAVKFTEQGSVGLRATVRQDDGRPWLCVEIRDTGRGISEEMQEILFSEFGRVIDQQRPTVEGTGLGLATCKRIIESMDGRMGVSSAPGSGSVFSFTIPILKPVSNASKKAGSDRIVPLRETFGAPPRILFADDAPSNRIVMSAMLEKMGCEATAVSDGEEVLQLLQSSSFDAIMLDNYMMSMGGVETAKEIRSLERSPARTPIIAITGSSDSQEHDDLLAAGVDRVLVKPVPEAKLHNTLQTLLGSRSTQHH